RTTPDAVRHPLRVDLPTWFPSAPDHAPPLGRPAFREERLKHHPCFATPKTRPAPPFPARLLLLLALLLPGVANALAVVDGNGLGRLGLPAGVEVAVPPLDRAFADIDRATFRPIPPGGRTAAARDTALWLRFRLDNSDNPRDTQ